MIPTPRPETKCHREQPSTEPGFPRIHCQDEGTVNYATAAAAEKIEYDNAVRQVAAVSGVEPAGPASKAAPSPGVTATSTSAVRIRTRATLESRLVRNRSASLTPSDVDNRKVVEPPGIEPGSERGQPACSTCVALIACGLQEGRRRHLLIGESLVVLASPMRRISPLAIHQRRWCRRPGRRIQNAPTGYDERPALPVIARRSPRQPFRLRRGVQQRLQQLKGAHPFYVRGEQGRHARTDLPNPSKPCRPHEAPSLHENDGGSPGARTLTSRGKNPVRCRSRPRPMIGAPGGTRTHTLPG